MKRIIAIFLIIIGICLFLYPKISSYLEQKNEIRIIKEYQKNVNDMPEKIKNEEYELAKQYNKKVLEHTNKDEEYNNVLNPSKNGIMSYIEIPKIKVYLPIYHGTESEVLKKGIGHLKNTSLPVGGEMTNSVLTGHTGLAKNELFTRLDELEIGDKIYIYTLDEQLSYEVYQKKVVLPYEKDDLKVQENRDIVTLVTCTPYGVNTHRLLVQCERIENIKENQMNKNNSEIDIIKRNRYYLKGLIYGLAIIIAIILCCIFFKYIVKYIKKVRKRK